MGDNAGQNTSDTLDSRLNSNARPADRVNPKPGGRYNLVAILDGKTDGFVKIHAKRGTDRILGATIVARHAGEMINEISFTMGAGRGLKALFEDIHPYPTRVEALRGAALEFNRNRLATSVWLLTSSWLRFRRSGTFRRIGDYLRGAKTLFRQHGRRTTSG